MVGDGLFCKRKVRMTGQEQDQKVRIVLRQPFCEVKPGSVWHLNITDHDLDIRFLTDLSGSFDITTGKDLINSKRFPVDCMFQCLKGKGFIVYKK